MGIVINNTSFRLNNSSFSLSPPITRIGQVFRLQEVTGIASTFSYTNISGSTVTTPTIASGSVYYILALSGSIENQYLTPDSSPITNNTNFGITNLIITSSVDFVPTFTEELITTAGAGNWTKPAGVTQVVVECWGGGGAGGGASVNGQQGSGGAGGSFSRKLVVYESASSSRPYSIAAAVIGTAGNGGTGNDTTWETNVVVAKGGGGGLANDLNGSGAGLSQAGSIGDIIHESQPGGNAFTGRGGDIAGFGGSSGGSTGQTDPRAVDGLGILEYGAFGADPVGFGSIYGIDVNGNPGNMFGGYGGGGGGASRTGNPNKLGGDGGQGIIRLIYR